MKVIALVAAALLGSACARSGQPQPMVLDGIASVDGEGNISVLDTSNHRWFSVYPDKAANIPSELSGFRSTSTERCWVRIYGVRASGSPFGKDLLRTRSIDITRRYADTEVPGLLDGVQFQPLKTKHTCGSA